MYMSIILAKFLGILLTILGLGICMNHHSVKDLFTEVLHHKSFSFSSVIMPLLLGSVILSLHHVWVDGWALLITLVGYFFLIVGMMRAIMPDFWVSLFKKMKPHISSPVYGLVVLIVGLVLIYNGFLV